MTKASEAFAALSADEQAALAEQLASPVVVPRHVLISLMMAAGMVADLVEDGDVAAITKGYDQEMVVDRETTQEERDAYAAAHGGKELPETISCLAGEIYQAIEWAEVVLHPDDHDHVGHDDVEDEPEPLAAVGGA